MKINSNSAFAIVQKLDSDELLYLQGKIEFLENVNQIKTPSIQELNQGINQYISLSIIPFHQAYEKGYNVYKSEDKIISLNILSSKYCSLNDVLNCFQKKEFNIQKLNFEMSNAKYKILIKNIIENEIANGEGCNFVIPRKITSKIIDINLDQALTIFTSLVKQDYGTYWKFIFYTGDRYFIGSTPERHLEIIGNEVRMNPVSGTLFKKEYFKNKTLFKKELIKFLSDPKEINELFMVLEEELKMMCKITQKGGMVIGPILKEMSRLIHTEYLLNGTYDQKKLSILDILRESFFATTVTGSPLENAFNVICKYEDSPRQYYGSSIVLIGTNPQGQHTLDSPILIRTLDIKHTGDVFFGVGATLVKDSQAEKELEETFVKSEALLNSLYQNHTLQSPRVLSNCMNDDEIHLSLQKRNQELSKFWFFQQHHSMNDLAFNQKKVLIINNDDDFCYMLAHLLYKMGFIIQIISYQKFSSDLYADIYIIGPGPGNPNNFSDYKMLKIQRIISTLSNKKYLAICLGHQLLCKSKGFKCKKLTIPMQGEQREVSYFGKKYFLGFYNTFIPIYQDISKNKEKLQFSLDIDNNIIAVRGENFTSLQFHPESILSEYGYDILKQELHRIL